MAKENALQLINRMYADLMRERQVNYRYYQDKKKNNYFYTTKKINHKGSLRYVAGIYRYRKTTDDWKLVKKVGFAKKKRAIEWARTHWEKAQKNN